MWRRRPIVLALVACVVVTLMFSSARADLPDDPEGANRALDRAEQRLRHAHAALLADEHEASRARAAYDAIVTELDQTIDAIRQREQRLPLAEREARQAAEQLAALERELPALQARHDELARRARELSEQIDRLRQHAWDQFAQMPDFVAIERELAEHQQHLDEAIEQVARGFETDPANLKLTVEAQQAEADVERLRTDARAYPDELAAASQAWLDARSRLRNYREQATAAHPAVRAARAALDDAGARRDAMVQGFEQSLEADPQVRDLTRGLRDVESELPHAVAELRRAVAARDSAGKALQSLESESSQDRAQLAQLHDRAEQLERQIDWAADAARRADEQLRRAVAHHADAVREHDAAECRYREALERLRRDDEHRRREREHEDRGKRYEPDRRDDRHDDRHRQDKRARQDEQNRAPAPRFRVNDDHRRPAKPEDARRADESMPRFEVSNRSERKRDEPKKEQVKLKVESRKDEKRESKDRKTTDRGERFRGGK